MIEWIPGYEFFWDSVRRENPYNPRKPFRWFEASAWKRNPGKRTTIMMLLERDGMNFDAQRLLDKRVPLPYIPRSVCKMDIRIPLERKVLTDLALKNWW